MHRGHYLMWCQRGLDGSCLLSSCSFLLTHWTCQSLTILLYAQPWQSCQCYYIFCQSRLCPHSSLTQRILFSLMKSICVSSVPVACCSHRSLDFPRPHSIGSGSTASTTLSQSSSSSGRGSLPPAGYPGNLSQGVEPSPTLCSSHDALMDNELNSHHLHQHLHDNCEHWKRLHPLSESVPRSTWLLLSGPHRPVHISQM